MPKLCAFGCVPSGVPMHRFPKADKFPERFKCWVDLIGGKLDTVDDFKFYQQKLVCDKHFTAADRNRNNRLNVLAVPSLYLHGNSESIMLASSLSDAEMNLSQPSSSHDDTLSVSTVMKDHNYTVVSRSITTRAKEKMLEVCVDSLESAINAIHGGADELEVCSSLSEGGLTPSAGLVIQIRKMIDNLALSPKRTIRDTCHQCRCDKLTKIPKLNVMIRCRTGSDFHYTKEEMDTMLSDIEVFKQSSVDRFVFGALTSELNVDEVLCTKIIQEAYPIPVTFHRAFDMCLDPHEAIHKIYELGFNRVLTSGQKSSACDDQAIELIEDLMKSFGHKIQIMPGAGVTVDNVKKFTEIGCEIVHSSCKRVKYLPKLENALSMGTGDSEVIWITDESVVTNMKEIM